MSIKTSFGQWLKQRRKALDLTQDDLAVRIGCATVTLYKIEADERRPSKQIAELLAEILNIAPDERAAFVNFARREVSESAAPWGTAFHPPTNLPTPPTVLIGRDEDVAAICKRLLRDDSHLLTLVGPPGIGKTRLALQVAVQVLDDFSAGVFFVPLAPITDEALVAMTIANTFGLTNVAPQNSLERLKAFLRDKQMLLILDNFEQILAAAPQIAELLAGCPLLKILITSRAPLRIRQERQLPISALAVPNPSVLHDIERAAHYPAITLFIERAQAVQPDFSLTEENMSTVVAICTRLDGLPLAIELISARIKLLSPNALLERLHGRVMLQSDGLRDIEPRHRTLNNAIDWSYQLLNADEQTLFRRLGVFINGWTLESTESVCMDNLSLNLLDALASLLDKNLIKQDTASNGEPRFMMLETIREYALQQLIASGEEEMIQMRHAEHCLRLVQKFEIEENSPQGFLWLNRLEKERFNISSALSWSFQCNTTLSLKISAGMYSFWQRKGYFNEGRQFLEQALSLKDENNLSLRAPVLRAAGILASNQGDYLLAQFFLDESISIYRTLKDLYQVGLTLHHIGSLIILQQRHQDFAGARSLLVESLIILREYGTKLDFSRALTVMANLTVIEGDYPVAESFYTEALTITQDTCGEWATAPILHNLAILAGKQSQVLRAKTLYKASLAISKDNGNKALIGNTLNSLANLAEDEEDYDEAKRLRNEALILFRELGATIDIEHQVIGLGYIAIKQGDYAKAQKLLENTLKKWVNWKNDEQVIWIIRHFATLAAGRMQIEISVRLFAAVVHLFEAINRPLDDLAKLKIEHEIAAVHAQLKVKVFNAAWAEGQMMTMEQAVNYALEDKTLQTKISLIPPAAGQLLTDRELEILRLIAEGLNSREVAERLMLSVGTIRWYLKVIYGKLYVHSRSEAIARAKVLKLLI